MQAAQAGRMRTRLTGLLALTALGAALSASARFVEQSSLRVGTTTTPLKAWCDAPQGVVALGDFQAGAASGVTSLTVWPKTRGLGSAQAAQVRWGPSDAGAGNVYWPLTVLDGARKGQAGVLHTSNVENVQDPAYRLTRVVEFRVPAGTFRCRYVPQAAVLAATAKHSVVVWEQGGKVTYASRNRDGTAGVQLTGGTHTRAAGGDEYQWRRGGYTYALEVGRDGAAGGRLSVSRGGRLLSREALLAYSVSVSR